MSANFDKKLLKVGAVDVYRRTYPDLRAMVETAQDKALTRHMGEYDHDTMVEHPFTVSQLESRIAKASATWDYGFGFSRACDMLLRDGWPEGLAVSKEISGKILGNLSGMLAYEPQIIYDVSGAALDIGAYMTGEPECFLDFPVARQEKQGKVLTILVNVSINAGIPARQAHVIGAAIMSFLDLLEMNNMRAELLCATCTYGGMTQIEEIVLIKPCHQAIAPGMLVPVLAHAAFDRRVGFALFEQWPRDVRRFIGIAPDGTYGGACSISRDIPRDIDLDISSIARKIITVDSATAWVLEQARAQGIEILQPATA